MTREEHNAKWAVDRKPDEQDAGPDPDDVDINALDDAFGVLLSVARRLR